MSISPGYSSGLVSFLPVTPGDRTGLYRIALQEGHRALDDQRDEVRSLRDRGLRLAGAADVASAFLLAGGHPARWSIVPAACGGFATAWAMAVLGALLVPRRDSLWHYRVSPVSLITGWIETDPPPPGGADFIRALARLCDEMRIANERLLQRLRWWYVALIIAAGLQMAAWMAFAWVR